MSPRRRAVALVGLLVLSLAFLGSATVVGVTATEATVDDATATDATATDATGNDVAADDVAADVTADVSEIHDPSQPVVATVDSLSPYTQMYGHGQQSTGLGYQSDGLVGACAAASPDDHADPADGTAGTVGWVDGYWYDEPIEVDASDGLTDDERVRLTARTAARVEALRCLTFEELPPVEVVDRETYATETTEDVAARAERVGDLKNAQYEAMLIATHEQDWGDVRTSVLADGVGAYYDSGSDQITMIVEEPGDPPVEHVLAHELVHALQDQHHDLGRFDASLQSARDAELGLLEGDAVLVQEQYQTRCQTFQWSESCVDPVMQPPSVDAPLGVLLLFQQPYLYGPPYVEAIHDDGGWADVDDQFDDVPTHSSQVVAPETSTTNVSLPQIHDRSTDEWDRVTAEGRPDHEVVGQAALTTMLAAPTFEAGTERTVIERSSMVDSERGTVAVFDQPETRGWDGDRLHAYTDGDRLATVWALEWTDESAAEAFATAYRNLLEIRGASALDDGKERYVFESGSEFGDGSYFDDGSGIEDGSGFGDESNFDATVAIRVEGDRVEITTAPSATALSEVRGDESADADALPGFGVGVAAVVLVVTAMALGLGRRRYT